MSYHWSEQRRDGQRNFDPWEKPNGYQDGFPYFKDYNDPKQHCSRFNQDRSRSRVSSYTANSFGGDNKFNAQNNKYRNRGNRRSSSAPRTFNDDIKNRWTANFGQTFAENRSKKCNASFNYDHFNYNSKNSLKEPQIPQQKKFKSIFGPGADAVKTAKFSKEVKVNNIGHGRNSDLKEPFSANTDVKIEALPFEEDLLNRTSRFKYNKEVKDNQIVKFYGESLTELVQQPIEVFKTELPVVGWSKDSSSIDTIAEFDSTRAVGGDGITLEVFYLCKYCKMFTGGCQLDAHLKSKYHYERYKEYLRTGEITNESSSNTSHSTSESETDISKSPIKQQEHFHKNAMDIDDPADIVYDCHQELDFD